MRSRLPAPTSLSPPGIVLALVAAAIYLIARSTGAGWDIVLLCGLVAVLGIAATWPGIALATVRATASAPRDATVGRVLPIDVALRGRARGLHVRVSLDAGGSSAWARADAPCAGTTNLVPSQRGVFGGALVEIRSSSPLGLVGWRRWIRVELDRPIEVAPRPITIRYEAAARCRSRGPGPTASQCEWPGGDPWRARVRRR